MVIKRILVMLVVLVMIAGSFSSCAKKGDACTCNEKVCEVDNPLTDLPWLKEVAKNMKMSGHHGRIYQCTYKDGIGFLIQGCLTLAHPASHLYNCDGIFLCGCCVGEENYACSEYVINFETIKLILEYNKK